MDQVICDIENFFMIVDLHLQIAFLDGMSNGDGYPICRHIWDSEMKIVFATSERDNKVFGFNTFTEKIVYTLEGSKAKVRNLDYK